MPMPNPFLSIKEFMRTRHYPNCDMFKSAKNSCSCGGVLTDSQRIAKLESQVRSLTQLNNANNHNHNHNHTHNQK